MPSSLSANQMPADLPTNTDLWNSSRFYPLPSCHHAVGAPLTHLITDLLQDTGEELTYHQFPGEVLMLGAIARAQGL